MATVRQPPPWATAPQLEFQLFKHPAKLAKSYHCLRANVSRLLMQKADEEGGTQFVQEVQIADSLGFIYEIPELPTTPSYFIIVMLPPPDIEYEKHLHREVKLLFAANTLYHLGFSADDVWRVFNDAILPGVEQQNKAKYNIERLDFGGSYNEIGMDYKELVTGFDGQLDTYKVLVDLRRATRNQIVKVSCRNVVTFSEPIRFPFLFKLHVTNFQQGNLCAVLDAPVKKDETHRNMSSHFTVWSNYSDKCRGGREKFDAVWELHDAEFNKDLIPGVPTYESLLNFLFLLSNKDHNKTHKGEQPEKHIKHSFANPEDHKGGEDEDPTGDKDGNDQGERRRKHTSSAFFFESPVAPYNWITRALNTAEVMTEMVFIVMICTPSDYNMQPLDAVYCNFIGALPMVKYRSGNIKRLIYISTWEVHGKIIGSFLAKDHPHNKVTASPALNWIGPRMDFIPDTDGPSEGAPQVLACFSKNLLRRETWKLADSGNSQRTYVCIKEAQEAPVLMTGAQATALEYAKMITDAYGNAPGEQPLIAVSSKRLYGEGYNDRIPDVRQLVSHIFTVGGPNTSTAREFTEMMTYVHGSVPEEPLLDEHLIEASAEQLLDKGYDDSDEKRIHGVAPINNKQLGEPPLEDPLIEASTEQFLDQGYDDSDKRNPDVTLITKQLGWKPNDAPPKDRLATTLTT